MYIYRDWGVVREIIFFIKIKLYFLRFSIGSKSFRSGSRNDLVVFSISVVKYRVKVRIFVLEFVRFRFKV